MQSFISRDLILGELDFSQSGLSERRASDRTAWDARRLIINQRPVATPSFKGSWKAEPVTELRL